MLKLGLWTGTPTLVTFLASPYSLILDDIVFFFLLSLAAMAVAILPRITNKA